MTIEKNGLLFVLSDLFYSYLFSCHTLLDLDCLEKKEQIIVYPVLAADPTRTIIHLFKNYLLYL